MLEARAEFRVEVFELRPPVVEVLPPLPPAVVPRVEVGINNRVVGRVEARVELDEVPSYIPRFRRPSGQRVPPRHVIGIVNTRGQHFVSTGV